MVEIAKCGVCGGRGEMCIKHRVGGTEYYARCQHCKRRTSTVSSMADAENLWDRGALSSPEPIVQLSQESVQEVALAVARMLRELDDPDLVCKKSVDQLIQEISIPRDESTMRCNMKSVPEDEKKYLAERIKEMAKVAVALDPGSHLYTSCTLPEDLVNEEEEYMEDVNLGWVCPLCGDSLSPMLDGCPSCNREDEDE